MQKRIKILQSSLVEEKVFSVQQKLDEATTFPQERICVISKNGKICRRIRSWNNIPCSAEQVTIF